MCEQSQWLRCQVPPGSVPELGGDSKNDFRWKRTMCSHESRKAWPPPTRRRELTLRCLGGQPPCHRPVRGHSAEPGRGEQQRTSGHETARPAAGANAALTLVLGCSQ